MTITVERIEELISAGRLEQAESELNAAPPSALEPHARHFCAGLLAERQSRWSDAADAYWKALDEDPDDIEATFRLAHLVDRLGEDEQAIELYESCTDEAPAHVNALLNLAVLYEDQERYEEALACLERVLQEYPNHHRANLYSKDVASALDMYYDEERERFREKRDALLDTPISEFELSVRSRNCLKQMDINVLGDLLRTTPVELLAYKNFGETSLHEIEAMLALKGLRLGQLLEEREDALSKAASLAGSDPAKVGVLNRSVAELELSVRSRKCLMRLGINAIGELTQRSEPELLGIKNFGLTSLNEIKRRLAEYGLALKAE